MQEPNPQENPQTALAVAPPAQASLTNPTSEAAAMALLGGNEVPYYCSFDLKSEAGQALLFRAAQTSDNDLFTMSGQIINVEHVYAAHAYKLDEKTGEEIALVRIVLVEPDGRCLQCYSTGIRKSINLLAGIYGLPPWKGGRRLLVQVERLRSGKNYLTLQPAPAEPTKGGKSR